MDVVADLEAPCGADELFGWVDDLGRYPSWLDIVSRAEPWPEEAEDGPAWRIDLRGRLGPLARSKRLRMVRTELDAPRKVTFERRELDGRQHAAWRLQAEIADTASGTMLTMRLHYGGGLWGPVLERVLGDEIQRSRPRLLALLAAPE